jgi:glycosyltransferase involved in cell wall biosynthesis
VLTIVIPVFEGEHVVAETIDAVRAHATRRGWDVEILVGYSRGRDRTWEVLGSVTARCPDVRVIDTTARFGKGGAVRTLMLLGHGDVRCFIDADNGVSFDQIDAALALLEDCDLVIGSRYIAGGDPGRRSLVRTALSRGGSVLMRVFLGLRYADTRAPLKVFRGPVAVELFSKLRLDSFGFDSELLFLADRHGYRVRELPVRYEPFDETTVHVPAVALRSIMELVEIRWNWVLGRYGDR